MQGCPAASNATITADNLNPAAYMAQAATADAADVRRALRTAHPRPADFAALLSPAAGSRLEDMAQQARRLTLRHFGKNITLYVPLYISNHCANGCAYCGFAADRRYPRRHMTPDEIRLELAAIRRLGFDEILLLTGERGPHADFDYLRAAVAMAAEIFHLVTVEAFPMDQAEYRGLALAGCQGITIYQETYDPETYIQVHRWGPKRDYQRRLNTPELALAAGMRTVGLGALLGLVEPRRDAVSLFLHVQELQRRFWRAGFSISFPRLRPETGGFIPPHPVNDRLLAQIIYAFRICLPDVPLVLSTREGPAFRDGMAGVGINKMSIASRTTVGGYQGETREANGAQFQISDHRDIAEFFRMLRSKGLEPVFKSWDRTFSMPQPAAGGADMRVDGP